MNVSGSGGASASDSGNGGVSASGGVDSESGSAGVYDSGSGGVADSEAGSSGVPESGGVGGAGGSAGGTGGALSGAGGSVGGAGGSVGGAGGSVGGAVSGAGGISSAGGVGGVGGAVGQGGGPPTCQSAQDSAKLLVDDVEDGDYTIQPINAPYGGTWYIFNDGTGNQLPDDLSIFKPVASGNCTPKFAAGTSGDSFTIWGAGLGVTFSDFQPHAFDASAYSGIQFWAKANVTATNPTPKLKVKVMVGISGTTGVANGGTCVPIDKLICEDHYYMRRSPILTQEWAFYTITFADAAAFGQAGFGPQVPFDKAQILSLQFLVPPSSTPPASPTFDFSVDDVAFF
ncbi:MAG TPA: hypothetical protein VER96_07850 [Polyangiaceae bacterium]|nr:hypothetical protein [Polyangiaceae bacterium]